MPGEFINLPVVCLLQPLFLHKHIRIFNTECSSKKETEKMASYGQHNGYGLDSLFQKTPIITQTKRFVQPGDAFEDTAFKPGFENVKL
jgi:hypothetical protein